MRRAQTAQPIHTQKEREREREDLCVCMCISGLWTHRTSEGHVSSFWPGLSLADAFCPTGRCSVFFFFFCFLTILFLFFFEIFGFIL